MEKAVSTHPDEFMSTSSVGLTSSGLCLSLQRKPCSGYLMLPVYFPDGHIHTVVV